MKKLSLGLIFSLSITPLCWGATSGYKYFGDLFSKESALRDYTIDTITTRRQDEVKELIAIVSNPPEKVLQVGPWTDAIQLIRLYRAPEAAPTLVEHLTVLPVRTERFLYSSPPQIQASYPCAAALLRIGEPSDTVSLLIPKIVESKKKEERELALWVVMQLRGKDATIALVNERLSKTAEQPSKDNLKTALTFVQNFKQTYGLMFRRVDGTIERF